MIGLIPALIVFGEMHFLLISEHEFLMEKGDGRTRFMAFMKISRDLNPLYCFIAVGHAYINGWKHDLNAKCVQCARQE